MSNEFQSSLYQTQRQMLDAIAESWVGANGMNSEAEVEQSFADATDDELTAEAIEGFGLNEQGEYDAIIGDCRPSHMEREEYGVGDLAAAFTRLRVSREATDDQIQALYREAGEHGDGRQIEICRRALGGDAAARRECARVIDAAQAMAG